MIGHVTECHFVIKCTGIIIHQVVICQQEYLQERRDRGKVRGKMEELKDQSTVIIDRLKTEIQSLTEDYQISQSQIIAYKKQLDACKKELEEERRRASQMKQRIDMLNAIQEEVTILTAEVCLCTVLATNCWLYYNGVYLSQNEKLKKGEHTRANRLEQEVEQLRRNVGNYQMEQTRANRLEQEIEQLIVQYRELEKMNIQLKMSNQVCTIWHSSCVLTEENT